PSHMSILVSISRTCPPPSSPLFPYTTLFRSVDPEQLRVLERSALERVGREVAHRRVLRRARPLPASQRVLAELGQEQGVHHLVVDRKSTRLNSSHVSISYAVFCLKKKNEGGV